MHPPFSIPACSIQLGFMNPPSDSHGFDRLYKITRDLRSPDGCPWDKAQTPSTLRASLIEEAYEAIEAIDSGDLAHVREELGDVFLMTVMISYIYEQETAFSVDEVLHQVCKKLIRRHPHVYGDAVAESPDEVAAQWKQIKETEKGRNRKSLLDEVNKSLPPLERAYRLQKKAAKVGFDWQETTPVWNKIEEELAEARQAWQESIKATSNEALAQENLEEELGDLLFSIVNLSRFLGIDPSLALQRTNSKFMQRFRHVEQRMQDSGKPLGKEHIQDMDQYWEEAKAKEKTTGT